MIRKATLDDFEQILDMAGIFWEHTCYSEPFNRDATLPYIELAFNSGLLAVAEVAGIVKGFCAAISYRMMGSGVLSATELAWWIDDDARGGKLGISLLKFMESLAQEAGVKYWNMIAMKSSMFESVSGMYKKMGYVENEATFTKVF